MYEYQDIGFEGVFLTGGVCEVSTMFGKGIQIQAMDDLHRVVLRSICRCGITLSPGMIRALRTELDLSQPALGELLGLTGRQSVSLYERGTREMPKACQVALKLELLGVMEGCAISTAVLVKELKVPPPQRFEFAFEGGGWKWVNSPHFEPQRAALLSVTV